MVKGIDQFKAHFANFADRYVLIGGVACYLAMEEAGLEFRVTNIRTGFTLSSAWLNRGGFKQISPRG
jgi:hypothetical protein